MGIFTNFNSEEDKMSVGELFAGIGGICLAFRQAGFDIGWANELDKKAYLTYSKNFNNYAVNEDMRKVNPIDLRSVDVLAGGFPCQSFSIAGYQKGFNDERGNLFFDILNFIDVLRPPVIFLENVKNLLSHDCGRTFKIIQGELSNAGYYIKYKVMNTAEYSDVPQNRERLYIVCFGYKEHYLKFKFPKPVKKTKSIRSLLDSNVSEEFSYKNSRYYDKLKDAMKNPDTLYQWRRTYVRENKKCLCPTLTANMGTGGHNVPLVLDGDDIRKLTPRECARFQGFPDSFVLPKELPNPELYKQIGNSVSVPVVKAIAKNILAVFE